VSAEGFALGFLAASQAGAHTGRAVSDFMVTLYNRRPQIDVNALINEALLMEQQLAHQDAHIAQQDGYIKGLKREVAELRAHAKRVEDDRDALLDWAAKADAELKRWRSGG
jgi:hypothetical protein